jgi:geranylgeranyl pyrophosphate synthase
MKLAEILASYSREMTLIEDELARLTAGVGGASAATRGNGVLSGIVAHPFTVPGKRIRPALVLLASRAAGAERLTGAHIRLAAAVELLHAASLVHDDVIDGADTRRHQVSLNKKYGNRTAVLAGDILYTAFFTQIISMDGVTPEARIELLDLFLDTTRTMCLGEILAQETDKSPLPVPYAQYLEIATDKTSALFSACCRSAAIVSGAEPGTADALGELGRAFGTLFQIMDDLMDGDQRLDPSEDLESRAAEFREQALDMIGRLRPGVYKKAFAGLVEYVSAQKAPV